MAKHEPKNPKWNAALFDRPCRTTRALNVGGLSTVLAMRTGQCCSSMLMRRCRLGFSSESVFGLRGQRDPHKWHSLFRVVAQRHSGPTQSCIGTANTITPADSTCVAALLFCSGALTLTGLCSSRFLQYAHTRQTLLPSQTCDHLQRRGSFLGSFASLIPTNFPIHR